VEEESSREDGQHRDYAKKRQTEPSQTDHEKEGGEPALRESVAQNRPEEVYNRDGRTESRTPTGSWKRGNFGDRQSFPSIDFRVLEGGPNSRVAKKGQRERCRLA